MNEGFYSIGRGSLNINGKFYCGLDYQITDFMRSLEEENKQLKENNLAMQEEMARTWAKLQQKEDIINKTKEYVINNSLYEEEYDYDYEENIYLSGIHDDDVRRILLEILDNTVDENDG